MSITNKITVKRAEIAVAVILALCSIALMIKSAENRITWNAEENMGAGFLPFYLSLGMLICTILTIIKFVLKRSPQSKDDTPFIDDVAFKFIAVTIISLVVLVLAIGYLGIYFSLIFFLAFYLRYFSEKSVAFITIFAITTPILTFLFFELTLKIYNFIYTENIFIFVLVISSISQIGDIIISYFKRLSKIKDTGNIIPGHGGILDRIDGMIFAYPFSYIIFLIWNF